MTRQQLRKDPAVISREPGFEPQEHDNSPHRYSLRPANSYERVSLFKGDPKGPVRKVATAGLSNWLKSYYGDILSIASSK
jgi:hypothetical protein